MSALTPCPFCGNEHPETDDPDPCPGDCNRAWTAAERAAFNEHARAKTEHRPPRTELVFHDVPMIAAAPIWCRPCQENITTVISGFPKQCKDLTPGQLNTGRDAGTGPHPAAVTPLSPSPAWDQADEIIRWAVNTEDQLRAHIGDHGRGGQRPWRTLGSAAAYLAGHATALLCCPDAVAIGFEALKMSRRLELVTGTDRVIHHLPGVCLVCDRRGTLQRKDGDDLVRCKACGACWDIDQYNFIAKAYADGVHAG